MINGAWSFKILRELGLQFLENLFNALLHGKSLLQLKICKYTTYTFTKMKKKLQFREITINSRITQLRAPSEICLSINYSHLVQTMFINVEDNQSQING